MRRHSYRKTIKTAGIVVFSFAMIAGCAGGGPLADPVPAGTVSPQQTQAVKSVKVMKASRQKIGDPIQHAGEVQPSLQFELFAKTGGDVGEIIKKRGDSVQEGEVILRLKSTDADFEKERQDLALQTASDALARAKQAAKQDFESKQVELADSIQKTEQDVLETTRSFNKMRNDYDAGQVTKSQLSLAESELTGKRRDLEQLKQRQQMLSMQDSFPDLETALKSAQIAHRQMELAQAGLEVKAPVTGLLTELPVEAGMTLAAGTKVGLIQKLDPIKVKAQLTENEMNLIKGKQDLIFYLPKAPAEKHSGKITYMSRVTDPDTKTYELELEVPNKDMLLIPGMNVWIRLTNEEDQIALTVPTYSILKEGDQAYVFVLAGDTVEKRKVQLGRVNEPNQEVLAGIKEGEQVVVSGQTQLKDKEKVQAALVEGPK